MIFAPQHAYLLHSRPYQENKLLVELLTQEEGKIAAVTYAGQSQKSNKKALLQPFLPLNIEFKGKHQLKSLKMVEAIGKSYSLTGNPLYCGFYLNELLVRLLPESVPCHELFAQYNKVIEQLSIGGQPEPLLRSFEITLLEELGLALDFYQVSNCNTEYVSFNFDSGFEPSLNSEQGYATEHIIALGHGQLEQPAVLKTAKRLMRNLINQLLGNKPLNSRKLFEKRD